MGQCSEILRCNRPRRRGPSRWSRTRPATFCGGEVSSNRNRPTFGADKLNRRFTSFVISGDELLATFHPDDKPQQSQLVRLDIRTGADREVHSLPADAVKGGTAVDAAGHVFVTLENGQLLCFQGKNP